MTAWHAPVSPSHSSRNAPYNSSDRAACSCTQQGPAYDPSYRPGHASKKNSNKKKNRNHCNIGGVTQEGFVF